MHLQTNDERLLYELEGYQLRMTERKKKKSNLVNQEQKKISATVQSVRKMDVILGNSVEVSKRGMKNSTRTYSHIIYVKECSV